MRKLIVLLVALTTTIFSFGQSPQKMSYQSVIRNTNNQLVTSQQVGMRISILQGSVTGTAVYSELHTVTTNTNGLITLEIGSGFVIGGDFSAINWSAGPFFLMTETDPTGGTNYTITGTNQLLSVPFALHSKTAETLTEEMVETDPVFISWDKSTGISITESQVTNLQNYLTAESDPTFIASTAAGITQADTASWNAKLSSFTETDPVFTAWDKSTGISITESQISNLQNYLTAETDPAYIASTAAGITQADTASWNAKLSSFTETDPVFSAWDKSTGISITESQISNLQDYLTEETDPEFNASVAAGITSADTVIWNNKQETLIAGVGINITGNTINATGNFASNKFYLGQDTLGGIVFYIFIDQLGNQHGLIVSKTETEAKWQNVPTFTPAFKTWDGYFNMMLMADSPAKDWITNNFTSEWYLPALDEMRILWNNRFHVNRALYDDGYNLFSEDYCYWTSTQCSGENENAYVYCGGGVQELKTNVSLVRAVRSF